MKALIKKQLFDGKFEIQGEIAKGQTGTILYGYDIGLRQEVAIKIYHSHINGRIIRGKTFVEKSKPLLRLEHPNLIKIFKVEEESDTAVVFMEFFDAPSLQQLIHDKGKLSIQDMLILSREIAEVLVHTHFQGIIHGTLHPGHVLVGPQGQIKVMDLGLSWLIMDILSDGDEEILRPLPYFPPEIAKEELLNVSSDLYSLGFMMYEMVTGTVPYAGLPKTSIMGKLSFDQADPTFDFPAAMPAAICDLIREMTRNKTQERLQDATHVLTVISQQLSKLPLSKTSKFLPPEPPQPQAHTQEESTEPTKTSRTPLPSAGPEPSLKRAPQIQRPKSSVDYHQGNSTGKIGTILALIVVVGIAGGLGYWYRDAIEPYISDGLAQLENSSGKIIQKQTQPAKQNSSNTPPQDILDTSTPLVEGTGTVEGLKNNAQPVSIQKKSIVKPGAQPTKTTPVVPKIAPVSKTQATKITPVQKSTVKLPNASSTTQELSVLPAKKKPIAPASSTPVPQQPAKTAPPVIEKIPLLSPNTTKSRNLQKSPSQPKVEDSTQAQSIVPTKKPALSSPSPAPVQQLSTKTTPVVPENSPLATPTTPKSKSIENPASVAPDNETIDQEKKSVVAVPTSKETPLKATDPEIKEILQSLDAAKEDLSSIAAP